MQDMDKLEHYYTGARQHGPHSTSIYALWEKGEAFQDSVTPSTYCPEYRSHMAMKIASLTITGDRVFSLGCGNGFVEADLVSVGRKVTAIDYNEEAVSFSRSKGVEARTADFFDLLPADVRDSAVIYADGFLGHLFDQAVGLDRFFSKLKELALPSGAFLIFSNDAPRNDAPFQKHDRVEDFWFLSREFLAEINSRSGYRAIESYYFPYMRPISGLRNRTISIARVP